MSKVFRYKFTEDIVEKLNQFAIIHKDDDRHEFKDAWNIWVSDNEQDINTEIKRLTDLGFSGDIRDKMFKSTRYYFRKKGTEKRAPLERRDYVSLPKNLLCEMDRHITNNLNIEGFKPSNSFDDFCKNKEMLREPFNYLNNQGMELQDIREKIKKTYKNRYFVLRKKIVG